MPQAPTRPLAASEPPHPVCDHSIEYDCIGVSAELPSLRLFDKVTSKSHIYHEDVHRHILYNIICLIFTFHVSILICPHFTRMHSTHCTSSLTCYSYIPSYGMWHARDFAIISDSTVFVYRVVLSDVVIVIRCQQPSAPPPSHKHTHKHTSRPPSRVGKAGSMPDQSVDRRRPGPGLRQSLPRPLTVALVTAPPMRTAGRPAGSVDRARAGPPRLGGSVAELGSLLSGGWEPASDGIVFLRAALMNRERCVVINKPGAKWCADLEVDRATFCFCLWLLVIRPLFYAYFVSIASSSMLTNEDE